MCGQCGVRQTGWTERIAPLDRPGAAARRARALTALMRAAPRPRTRRTSAAPWHGGALQLRDPLGWRFAPSLLDALRDLTARDGPLLPLPASESGPLRTGAQQEPYASPPPGPRPGTQPGAEPASVRLAFDVYPEAAAAWCAALAAADLSCRGTVTLRTGATRVVLSREGVDVRAVERPEGPALWVDGGSVLPADRCATDLAGHWERTLADFRSDPRQALSGNAPPA